MNRLRGSSQLHFRLDAETLTLRDKDVIVRQYTPRRFLVPEPSHSTVIAATGQEKLSAFIPRTESRLSSAERRYETEQRTRLGWAISALLHGFVLIFVIVFNLHTTFPRVMPQKESFRWDVSLMTAPRPEAVVGDGVESLEDVQGEEIFSQELAERVPEPSTPLIESPQEAPIGQTLSSPDRMQQPLIPLQNTIQKTENSSRATAMSVTGSAPSVLPPPDVESQTDSKLLQVETELENSVVLQRPESVTRNIFNKAVLPDYAWLMETLRMKLERVKTYPALAKSSHVQGRVVVQVSIEGDGRIVNSAIEESSGYPVLDRAALEALQAASPLTLEHGLEGRSVVMLVPLNYQLE